MRQRTCAIFLVFVGADSLALFFWHESCLKGWEPTGCIYPPVLLPTTSVILSLSISISLGWLSVVTLISYLISIGFSGVCFCGGSGFIDDMRFPVWREDNHPLLGRFCIGIGGCAVIRPLLFTHSWYCQLTCVSTTLPVSFHRQGYLPSWLWIWTESPTWSFWSGRQRCLQNSSF